MAGLPTNLEFLRRLAAHPSFQAADLDTTFIKKHQGELLKITPPPAEAAALAAVARYLLAAGRGAPGGDSDGSSGSSNGARGTCFEASSFSIMTDSSTCCLVDDAVGLKRRCLDWRLVCRWIACQNLMRQLCFYLPALPLGFGYLRCAA